MPTIPINPETEAQAVNLQARHLLEESQLDQALVRVDQKTYTYFLETLDTLPSGEGFGRLMAAVKPWNG